MNILNYNDYLKEELSIDLISIDYKKTIKHDVIEYTFVLYDFNFIVIFEKDLLIKNNKNNNYEYGSKKSSDDIVICDIYQRFFETKEMSFNTINVSNTSSLKIFGIINKITEDFINEYNPDILQIHHISPSRFNINKLFMNKLSINNYTIIKSEFEFEEKPTYGKKQISTIIFKNNFRLYVDEWMISSKRKKVDI